MIGARLMRVVLDPADPLKVQHYVPFMCGGVPLDKCAAGGPVPPANKNQNKYRGACRRGGGHGGQALGSVWMAFARREGVQCGLLASMLLRVSWPVLACLAEPCTCLIARWLGQCMLSA